MGCCDVADPADPQAPLPLDAALARIAVDYACVVGAEDVDLLAAAGRILAEDVAAPFDAPPAPVSAMDGYGLVHPGAVEQTVFRLVGRVPAGSFFAGTVGPGEAVRIFTGAPVPAGVDVVVMRVDCCGVGESVRVRRRLAVRKPMRVVRVSTGDELREPGAEKPAWAIYDTNRYAVGALLAALGCDVEDLGILPDKPELVRAALADASARADLLVTSGGVSVGEEDHVKGVVQSLGRLDMWRLALRPGKPLALGRIGDAVFLGLPGNPVSAMVTFMLMGRPLALRLSGAASWTPARGLAAAGFSFKKKAGRREFLRVRLVAGQDGRPTAQKFPNDSSGVLTSMVEADGLADIPAEATEVKPGDLISVLPFTGLYG